MVLFMWLIVVAFLRISKALRASQGAPLSSQFIIWTLGAILFGHATAFWSISYFDQTIVFLCLVFACIGSLRISPSGPVPVAREKRERRRWAKCRCGPKFLPKGCRRFFHAPCLIDFPLVSPTRRQAGHCLRPWRASCRLSSVSLTSPKQRSRGRS